MNASERTKEPDFLNVIFDLPFIIWVRDSFEDVDLRAWAEAWEAGTTPPFSPYAPLDGGGSQLVIGGPLPVHVPKRPLSDYFLIDPPGSENIDVGIRLLRRANTRQYRQGLHMMGAVPGDRVGRLSYSSVLVMFDLGQFDIALHSNGRHFVEIAIDAVNHLIAQYRAIADRPWVNPVTPQTIADFRVETVFDDGTRSSYAIGASSGPLSGFGGSISDAEEQTLRDAVKAQDPPPIAATLDANIRDHLAVRDWRMAAIEAAVLFEAWLIPALKTRFQQNGLSESAIAAKFVQANGVPRSITSIARTLVLEACGLDFKLTSEYAEWAAKARDVRNELVHGSRIAVTRQEANDAYRSVLAASALIKNVL